VTLRQRLGDRLRRPGRPGMAVFRGAGSGPWQGGTSRAGQDPRRRVAVMQRECNAAPMSGPSDGSPLQIVWNPLRLAAEMGRGGTEGGSDRGVVSRAGGTGGASAPARGCSRRRAAGADCAPVRRGVEQPGSRRAAGRGPHDSGHLAASLRRARMEGLIEEPRPGAPRRVTHETVAEAVTAPALSEHVTTDPVPGPFGTSNSL